MFSSRIKIRPFPMLVAARADRATRHPAHRRLLIVAAGVALVILGLLPAMAVGAQSAYPANTVVSTYFDPRYGEVSVVTDASGNLIDVNAATGQRIYPVYPDYAPAYTNAYVAPSYVSANSYGYSGISAYTAISASRQYTDTSSNCVNGQVTQTASGYYCTATGAPAFRVA
ncbi:MAG: hypothetical protein M3Z19_10995 [Chloroflexota bacterium]|nr:hypothetical protein [Chloroflexota bacterium]